MREKVLAVVIALGCAYYLWRAHGVSPSPLPSPVPQPAPAPDPHPVAPPDALTGLRAELLAAHNAARVKARVGPLRVSQWLNTAAQGHAETMAKSKHLSHTAGGTNFITRVRATGYPGSPGGENIAWNAHSVASVMDMWMNSRGHRLNIQDGEFDEVGFGRVEGTNGPHWCVVFGLSKNRSASHTIARVRLPGPPHPSLLHREHRSD